VATINGWGPTGDAVSLREAMDRLLEQSFLRPRQAGSGNGGSQAWRMPLDVFETPHEFVIRAWAPGIKADELAITWDQGTLAIRGTIPNAYGNESPVTWHARELYQGEVYASVGLPPTIDVDKAQANYDAGVLTLRIPKAEAARPKRIRLQTTG
jgi:HSP20 family protein